jgi:pimeloyl-ACP methyl ester carboxylesterase
MTRTRLNIFETPARFDGPAARISLTNEVSLMPQITTTDGVKLYCEETGSGRPVVFVHEFSGDYRSWEPQIRYFSRRYRCITFNARGYPPSEVPEQADKYSQRRATEDIRDVLNAFNISAAHIVGYSMGGFATLHFGIMFPQMATSLVVGGVGFGAEPNSTEQFRREVEVVAQRFEQEGAAKFAPIYGSGPGREQYEIKDPRGFQEFLKQLGEHSSKGSALTMRGVQGRRPSPFEMSPQLAKLTVPTLVIHGDEDRPCLPTGVFLKQTIPSAGLMVMPKTGHTANLEEPALFNQAVQDFFATVEAGRWFLRDKRTESAAVLLDTSQH